jgi:hypothetical protein
MRSRINCLPKFIAICAIVWLGTNPALAQKSIPEFHQILRETAAFDQTDFVALEQGQTVGGQSRQRFERNSGKFKS